MKTPTTIEALETAIEMLKTVFAGGKYTPREFAARVKPLEDAALEHRRLELIEQRNRVAIREYSARRREAGA